MRNVFCLRSFDHITCSAADDDRHHAVVAAIRKPPSDWKWPLGRPNHTWLRAIEWDLRPLNIGPSCSRGRRQPLENTGVQLWTWLCSRRVYHEERDRENIFCTFYLFILMLQSRCERSNAPSLLIVICDNLGASTKLFCQVQLVLGWMTVHSFAVLLLICHTFQPSILNRMETPVLTKVQCGSCGD